ncbi:hypothetical protein EVAR_84669_1 [Eumeta japonica]|uniref:Uncharacterized protein n=1 Tax=Eumeta variegata TaxID=151549 RepID=A0A4C1UZW5_EUMVA|nr:hypothetical protein EVAR_84669_1 [Eumeta japonica]
MAKSPKRCVISGPRAPGQRASRQLALSLYSHWNRLVRPMRDKTRSRRRLLPACDVLLEKSPRYTRGAITAAVDDFVRR